jgi:REP element-mobilizing transposase RayT
MSQSLTKIYVHIIFSTKNRHPFLKDNEIREELFKYIAKILIEKQSFPLIVNGVEDHIHILCNLSKNISLAELVAAIKRSSSLWIKTKSHDYSKFYWQTGYAAFSVSDSVKEVTQNYISNQVEHHKKRTFKEELIDFFQKYDIEYDEKYIWE